MGERRRRRSDNPEQAIGLFLTRLSEEWGLSAAVISDADGLVVGGVSRAPGVDLEVLAATRTGRDVHATPLVFDGVTLYLVAQGRAIGGAPERERARDGVGRILELCAA